MRALGYYAVAIWAATAVFGYWTHPDGWVRICLTAFAAAVIAANVIAAWREDR